MEKIEGIRESDEVWNETAPEFKIISDITANSALDTLTTSELNILFRLVNNERISIGCSDTSPLLFDYKETPELNILLNKLEKAIIEK